MGSLSHSENFIILSMVGGGHHFLEFKGGGSLNFVVLKGVGQDILFSY